MPRLVVVVDELRALVDEVPDFVSGLVRLAALGRSLGVHLVLATQRPSGARSRAEIQANVSLRIAFRVRDRADSVDVLEDAAAAGIPPATPGRALARGGRRRLLAVPGGDRRAGEPRSRARFLEVTVSGRTRTAAARVQPTSDAPPQARWLDGTRWTATGPTVLQR